MGKSKIEWTERTWNPVTGCTPISLGCLNCYAKKLAETRLRGRFDYHQDDPFKVTIHPLKLTEPFHWRKPSFIFTCSMGDLFHDNVPMPTILQIFDIMQQCKQHTFVVCTKRPERALEFCSKYGLMPIMNGLTGSGETWPDNVICMVTVENQKMYNKRRDALKNIPASIKALSLEPLLEEIKFDGLCLGCQMEPDKCNEHLRIDWVIVGSESGPNARPMEKKWALSILDQCQEAGIPFFYKQGPDDNDKVCKMPKLRGKIWDQKPEIKG